MAKHCKAQKSRKEETDEVLRPINARQRTYVCSRYSMWPQTRYLRYFTLIWEMDCKVADQDESKGQKNIKNIDLFEFLNRCVMSWIGRAVFVGWSEGIVFV